MTEQKTEPFKAFLQERIDHHDVNGSMAEAADMPESAAHHDAIRKELQALMDRLNHPSQANASPEWVLVPREPTEAMVEAGQQMLPADMPMADAVYKMMCASAPRLDRDDLAFRCFAAMVQAEDGQDLRAEWAACGEVDKAPYLRIVDVLAAPARSTPKPAPDAPVTYAQSVSAACPNCGNGFVSVFYRAESPKPAPGDAARRAAEEIAKRFERSVNMDWYSQETVDYWAKEVAAILAPYLAQHTSPVLTEEERETFDWCMGYVVSSDKSDEPEHLPRMRALLASITRITGAQHG